MKQSYKPLSMLMLFLLLLVPVSTVAADWPMYLHNQMHSSIATDTGPVHGQLQWQQSIGEDLGWISPVVKNNRVYAGDVSGSLVCLDATTGAQVWKKQMNGDNYHSTPAVSETHILLCSRDGNVYAYYLSNNTLAWTYQTGDWAETSPVISEGKVYVASNDDQLYCLYESNGSLYWQATIDVSWQQLSSPILHDDWVYLCADSGTIYCFEKETGDLFWSADIPVVTTSSLVFADDRLYIGSTDGFLFCFDATPDDNQDGVIDKLDIDEGYQRSTSSDLIWFVDLGVFITSSATVVDDQLFISAWGSNGLLCLDVEDGSTLWHVPLDTQIDSTTAYSHGYVYLGTESGTFYCVNATDGDIQWQYQTDDAIKSSPAIYQQQAFVTSRDGIVYCFTENTAPVQPKQPTGATQGIVGTTYQYTTDAVTDPDGDLVSYGWEWNGDSIIDTWTTNPTTSITWDTPGSYAVKVRTRDDTSHSEWSSALMVTITGEPTQIQTFTVTLPDSVQESTFFEVQTFSQSNPVADVNIDFQGQQYTTNTQGIAMLQAPVVNTNKSFTLSFSKPGFLARTTTITVKNVVEPLDPEAWLFGVVSSPNGPVENTKLTITSASKNRVLFTDSTGRFVTSVAPGTYTVSASKPRFTSVKKEDILVSENEAQEVNFILELVETAESDSTSLVNYVVQSELQRGTMGAEIKATSTQPEVFLYTDDLSVDIITSQPLHQGSVEFSVYGQGSGRTMLVYLSGVIDTSKVQLEYDGEILEVSPDISSFFSSSSPAWLIFAEGEGGEAILALYIPQFSTHKITISSLAEKVIDILTTPLALALYAVILLVGIAGFFYPFVVWPRRMRKKEDWDR